MRSRASDRARVRALARVRDARARPREAPASIPIVESGPNGSKPHHVQRPCIEHNELVVLRRGCIVDGYAPTWTRTVSVGGDPGPDAANLYDVVCRVNKRVGAGRGRGHRVSGRRSGVARVIARADGPPPSRTRPVTVSDSRSTRHAGRATGGIRCLVNGRRHVEPGVYLTGSRGAHRGPLVVGATAPSPSP